MNPVFEKDNNSYRDFTFTNFINKLESVFARCDQQKES